MFKVSVGHSCDPDAETAIQEAINRCQQDLAGLSPNAGILLAAPEYDHQAMLDRLEQTFPDLELIGGTTNGEISSQVGFQQDSVVLTLFSSDQIEIKAGLGVEVGSNPHQAAQQAVKTATMSLTQPLQLCLAFPDGITANGSKVITGLKAAFSQTVPVVGGTTADDLLLHQAHQFYKTQVLSDALPILVFTGQLKLSVGVSSGGGTLGTQGRVTKSTENIVFEIDERPAREFYSHYFQDAVIEPDAGGVAVLEADAEDYYSRYLQEPSEAHVQHLKFMGNVPEGATIQLMESSRADLLTGAQKSIEQAVETYPGTTPQALLCFSCAGRRVVLGKDVEQEYQLLQAPISPTLPISGFYTYGEIAPMKPSGPTYYHNFTMVTLLLGLE